jgi:hypothetical protein
VFRTPTSIRTEQCPHYLTDHLVADGLAHPILAAIFLHSEPKQPLNIVYQEVCQGESMIATSKILRSFFYCSDFI